MEERPFYRKREGKVLFGVCAGMAEYMNLTPMTVRLIFAAMCLFFLAGIWVYVASLFVMPKEPLTPVSQEDTDADE